MYKFFLVVHLIIAASLVGVILMQRSEGGGLAGGGSPAGLMSARGAANFLTRATSVLAFFFIILSIGLAGLAITSKSPQEMDTSLAKKGLPAAPTSGVPMAGTPADQPMVVAPTTQPVVEKGASPAVKAPAPSAPKPTTRQETPRAKPSVETTKPVAPAIVPPPVVSGNAPAIGNSAQ